MHCPPGRCCQIFFETLTFLIHNMPGNLYLIVSSGFYRNPSALCCWSWEESMGLRLQISAELSSGLPGVSCRTRAEPAWNRRSQQFLRCTRVQPPIWAGPNISPFYLVRTIPSCCPDCFGHTQGWCPLVYTTDTNLFQGNKKGFISHKNLKGR